MHHRTAAFQELFLGVRSKLAAVSCVPDDDVLVLAASGTAAFEAGLLACVPAASKVIAVTGGKFGERWLEMARRYRYQVVELPVSWGEVAEPDRLSQLLAAHPDALAVLITHSETSTGVLHDVEHLARVVHQQNSEALVLVDGVTSLAVTELHPREWGLDAVFSGSQKGLMTPPGLSFAWLSERAWARGEARNPSFYLDLHRERERQRLGQTAFTPAVSLLRALEVALSMLLEEGLENVWRRRRRNNLAVLAAGEALGFQRFAARPTPAVAALCSPAGIAAPAVVEGFARRGARIAGGQDHTHSYLIRPSVVGYADSYDALIVAALLEDVLRDLGREVPMALGVAAAMEVLQST